LKKRGTGPNRKNGPQPVFSLCHSIPGCPGFRLPVFAQAKACGYGSIDSFQKWLYPANRASHTLGKW
jgi:hypothetical protein